MPLKQVFPKNNDKDIVAGVYEIKHISTGKSYIGSSGNLGSRAGTNKSSLRNGTHKNKPLQEAYNEDPKIELNVLKVCDTAEEALDKEQEYLDKLLPTGSLFNIGVDSRASYRGRTPSEETRNKLSVINTGRVFSSETIERMRKANTGKTLSEETKAKIRVSISKPEVMQKIIAANTGRVQSAEEREKKRLASLGKIISAETRELMRQVAHTPAKSVIIKGVQYPSIKEAARQLNINPGSLSYKLSSGRDPDYSYSGSKYNFSLVDELNSK